MPNPHLTVTLVVLIVLDACYKVDPAEGLTAPSDGVIMSVAMANRRRSMFGTGINIGGGGGGGGGNSSSSSSGSNSDSSFSTDESLEDLSHVSFWRRFVFGVGRGEGREGGYSFASSTVCHFHANGSVCAG